MLRKQVAQKPVLWMGSTYKDLLAFPDAVRKKAGFQIHRLQFGLEPEDWKSMPEIGPGICEIRINDSAGVYRLMYVARLENAIYVLHCFHKKTQRTTQHDKAVARARYQALLSR